MYVTSINFFYNDIKIYFANRLIQNFTQYVYFHDIIEQIYSFNL